MADTDRVLDLAAIIREVDGNHSKGAAALAESILDHPDFRAALTKPDEPAVPQGREPAAVSGRPSDEELADTYWKAWHEYHDRTNSVLHSVGLRAVLARWGTSNLTQTRLLPADGEVAELVAELQSMATDADRRCRFSNAELLSRAAELLQRQALVPVSVSERPWEREGWCDAEGKCWIRGKVEGDWRLINPTNSGVPNLKYCFTHCLPAHALPLPEVGE